MDKISILLTNDEKNFMRRNIPYKINEIELKGVLRDLGFIPTDIALYTKTEVFLLKEENNKIISRERICIDEYRTLEELGITDNSLIRINAPRVFERPTIVHHYDSISSMRCLYGCPMAESIEKAVNEAETYNHENSAITVESL